LGDTCHLLNPYSTKPLPAGVVLFDEVPVGYVGTLHGFEFGPGGDVKYCADQRQVVDDYDGSEIVGTSLDFEVANPRPEVAWGEVVGSLCAGKPLVVSRSFTWDGMAVFVRRATVPESLGPMVATRGPGQTGYFFALINGLEAVVNNRVIYLRDDTSMWSVTGSIPGAPGPDMDDLLAIAALLRSK
jgi:hypothetical protein